MNRALVCASHAPRMFRAGGEHEGPAFRAAMERARAAVTAFDPELVVIFGPEHRRTLGPIVPPFTVVASAHGYGDYDLSTGAFAVDGDVARALVEHLYADDFDVAHGTDVALDHGFTMTWLGLFPALDARPVVPVLINCVNPPLIGVPRTRALGTSIGAYLRTLDRRILVVASGGLSHSPRTLTADFAKLAESARSARTPEYLREAAKAINGDWDLALLRALAEPDWSALEELTGERLASAGSGANEIRTWIAALAASGVGASFTAYEPVDDWITGMGVAVGGCTVPESQEGDIRGVVA